MSPRAHYATPTLDVVDQQQRAELLSESGFRELLEVREVRDSFYNIVSLLISH